MAAAPGTLDYQFFYAWYQQHGGFIDSDAMGMADFPLSEGGRGAVALKDIPEDHVVFSAPLSLTLSTRTSRLPQLFGDEGWKRHKLHKGWSGLILCMLWEAAQGTNSKWKTYFDIMPATFHTPMFWSQDELAELQGTNLVEKVGRDQAEEDYRSKVIPALQSRPDLFPPHEISASYSLDLYHIMGSRILSRSFTISTEDLQEENDHPKSDDAMDTDAPEAASHNHALEEPEGDVGDGSEGSDDEDEEDEDVVAMVPMADMLNARNGCNNVKLFFQPGCLRMVTIKPIKMGDQIWNTYGDPPNAELLRAYGHVDYLPLPDGTFGNPNDVVEIQADLVLATILESHSELKSANLEERIDWWLEEGGDDGFVVETNIELPPALLSFTHLLLHQSEWIRAQEKGKPPKPKADLEVLSVIKTTLESRLAQYPTSLADDEQVLLLEQQQPLPVNKRNAVIVRVGEKRILTRLLAQVTQPLAELANVPLAGNNKKRGNEDASGSDGKRRKK